MFQVAGSYEEEDVNNNPYGGLSLPPAAIRQRELASPQEVAAAENVDRSAIRANKLIGHLTAPSQGERGPSLLGKLTPITKEHLQEMENRTVALDEIQNQLLPVKRDLEKVATDLKKGPLSFEQMAALQIPRFPDATLEAITGVCEQEKSINQKIKAHLKDVQTHQETIRKLQKLTALLSKHKDGDEPSQEMKDLVKDLNDQKIDLGFGNEKALSKEKAGDIKALIRDHQETVRTNIQMILQTEVHVLIQTAGMLIDCAKSMQQTDTSVKRGMLQRMVIK